VVADHGRQSVAQALQHAAQLYVELRNDAPPATTLSQMPELLLPFLRID
jgi:hypothetical protein